MEEQIRTTAVCVRLWCSVPPTKWFTSRSTRVVLWHSMVEDYRKHMGGLSAILEHDHDIAKLQAIANRRDEDLSRALVREMGNNEDIRKQVDACRREQVRHRQHTPLAERCATCMTAPPRSLSRVHSRLLLERR